MLAGKVYVKPSNGNLSMAIWVFMHTTVMTVCAEWLAGLVTGMDAYGVVVDRLKNIAAAKKKRLQKQQKSKKRKSSSFIPRICFQEITHF